MQNSTPRGLWEAKVAFGGHEGTFFASRNYPQRQGTAPIGKPNQPILQIDVTSGYAGLIILAGLNPLAAVEESGIDTHNMSLFMMIDSQELNPLM